jgi:hypothetical protein
MFRLLQIDPETLAIHINASAVKRHQKADAMFDFLNIATNDSPLAALISLGDENVDLDLLDFGSSFLHELRHFGDLLLSPFGFYRIRTAFEFYTNFPGLVFSNSADQVPIPLMSGMDPVNRLVMGMNDEFEKSEAFRIGKTSLTRVKLINSENSFDPSTGEIKIGSDRLLEGLAYTSQFELLFNHYNTPIVRKHFESFFTDYTGTEFDNAYRWFIPVVHSLHPNEVLPNNRLMQAIMFASLCGSIPVKSKFRLGGTPPKDLIYRDISNELPSRRYYKLIEYFSKVPRSSLHTDEEAAYLVNYACKVLFGKEIIEEIEEDIAHTDDIGLQYEEWGASIPPELRAFNTVPAFNLIKNYRKHIFEYFKKDITLFTSPNKFMTNTAHILRPSIVYNMPQGVPASVGVPIPIGKAVGLIDRRSVFTDSARGVDSRTIYSYWSPKKGQLNFNIGIDEAEIDFSSGGFEDQTLSSLQTIYGVYAPIYRWILFGNRYLTMSEFENDRLIEALGLHKDKFVFDEFYSKSQDISTSSAFFRFFGESKMKCDTCHSDVSDDESYVLSSRTIRQNSALEAHFKSNFSHSYEYLFKEDWSDWLLCTSCMLAWKFPIPVVRPSRPSD